MLGRRRRSRDVVIGTLCFTIAAVSIVLILLMMSQPNMGMTYMKSEVDARLGGLDVVYIAQGFTTQGPPDTTPKFTEDYSKAADVSAFEHAVFMIGNKSSCSDEVEILVYIQSAWDNFMKRRLLRRTWAYGGLIRGRRVKPLFILGRPAHIQDQVKVNNEQMLHGDIIEGDFFDSFQNITLKSVIALSWIHQFCPNIKYVVKSDDDIFVNLFEISDSLIPKMNVNQSAIACHVIEGGTSVIVRDKNSKWYVPPHLFPNMTHFPRFCSGYMVVMTAKAARELYVNSKEFPIVNIDDVYIFGQLTQSLNINFIDIKPNLTLSSATGIESYKKGTLQYVGVGVDGTAPMEELWSFTLLNEDKRVQ